MHISWILQIFPTWASHNLLNFNLMMIILDFLEAQDVYFNPSFDKFWIWRCYIDVKGIGKKWLLLTF